MDGGTDLADKVRSLEAELARAREAITTKDGELVDLHHEVNKAK